MKMSADDACTHFAFSHKHNIRGHCCTVPHLLQACSLLPRFFTALPPLPDNITTHITPAVTAAAATTIITSSNPPPQSIECVVFTCDRSPLVKTRPTLPTSSSRMGAQASLPVSSQYSLMERFIMVFLPIRMMVSGRRA